MRRAPAGACGSSPPRPPPPRRPATTGGPAAATTPAARRPASPRPRRRPPPAAGRRTGRFDRERRGRARDLDALLLQHAQQLGLRSETRIARRQHVRRRTFGLRLQDRALALVVEVAQEVQRGCSRCSSPRRECPSSRSCCCCAATTARAAAADSAGTTCATSRWRESVRSCVSAVAAVAERLVQAADAVVRRGHEHQVAGRPRVERAEREDAGHAHARHLVHVVPADHLPLVGQDRIEPRVVRPVADRVVVEERPRLVQVVQHLRLPVRRGRCRARSARA